MNAYRSLPLLSLLILVLLAACGGAPTPTAPPTAPPSPTGQAVPPTAEPTLTPATAPIAPPGSAVAPAPEVIQFSAQDGTVLEGMFYPAAVQPAPVVVLIHWIGGNRHEWDAIAPWIQGGEPFVPPAELDTQTRPYLDPAWFPAYPAELNTAVFSFSLRGCEPFPAGCGRIDEAGWLLDVQAAMQTAAGLPGVDPARVVTIGASIGADGALDGCYLYNADGNGKCLGALPLSPGGYLKMDYAATVRKLEQEHPSARVWCFDALGETECAGVSAGNHTAFQSSGEHGMFMIKPAAEPSVPEKIIAFMQLLLAP